jgi:HAD superfamily hydrolase (TIGR01509 family)
MVLKGDKMITIDKDIQGLIFDCDGTLVDSMPKHWEAWHETFAEYGLKCPNSYLEAHAGVPIKETLLAYLKDFKIEKDIDPDEFVAKKHKKSLEKLQEVDPIHEVVDVVKKYHGKLPMAVASGGARKNVITSLKTIDVAKYFEIIITSDDPIPGKPNPDIFVYAAYQMGVKPKNCLVFEDGDKGIEAAQKAGMKYFDVRTLDQ